MKVYGSYSIGTFDLHSDLDLSLYIPRTLQNPNIDSVKALRKIETLTKPLHEGSCELISAAKVPIIQFTELEYNSKCDISINNLAGVSNSQYLSILCSKEPRLLNLIKLVKNWARQQKINEAADGFLSSYCLSLMVLFLLQN